MIKVRIPCEIIGNRIIFLTKGSAKHGEFWITGKAQGRESEPLNCWNNHSWARAPELKRLQDAFEHYIVREQAYQEFKRLLEDARASRDYLIVEANEFKRALFINNSAITKRDAEKVFKCKILERKRRKRTLWIFQPE